ncbi:hypothetical protein CAEBREN_31544 [Caenorhabditis brenneri]|uniref:ABC transporter domain-containing protein n=1 Tax=Caenorhabditis brenneri TaxID=135651 RepID=G0N608_CAEBE|nr:hypothetical protein CAEBREN_31544 [Caenorhabditis brenneri]
MSNDIITPDDALTSPQEQKTQSPTPEYKSDRTQELSVKDILGPPIPDENSNAKIIEDDLEEADNRFRADPTQKAMVATVATDFGALENIGKKQKRKKKSKSSSKRRKCERVLKWKGVTVEEVKKKKKDKRIILDGVSGRAYGGELTFIMGSSGAGKTTLLNVLTGRNKSGLTSHGEISMNGRSLTPPEMKQLSAYVQQEDVFISSQTVSEVLHFAVKMRSPDKLNKKKRASLVEHMLTTFGLKNCEHTRVGSIKEKGISRGEKKRLTVAYPHRPSDPVLR